MNALLAQLLYLASQGLPRAQRSETVCIVSDSSHGNEMADSNAADSIAANKCRRHDSALGCTFGMKRDTGWKSTY